MVFRADVLKLNEKLKKEQRVRFTLIIFCIILAITAFVLIICYIIIKNKSTYPTFLCENDLCMRSAATLRLAMNTSVDPCDDFYKFACDRWSSEHPDHGWFSPVSAFTMIEETVTAAALKFLHTNASKTEPLPVKQSRDLYASCMNQEAADKLGYTPIFKYLSLLGLPSIPTIMNLSDYRYNKKNIFNWIRTEALATRLIGIQSFIGFSVDYNVTNNSQHFIMMGVPPLTHFSLPSFSNLVKPIKNQNIKSLRHLREVSKYIDEDSHLSEEEKRNMINFFIHTVVAANYSEFSELPDNFSEIVNTTTEAVMKIKNELSDVYEVANPPENCTNSTDCELFIGITVNDLQDATNKILLQFNLTQRQIWKPYLNQIFDGLNVTLDFNKNESLFVDQYDVLYLVTVVRYLSELPDELVELWLWWRTVRQLIKTTTTEIQNHFVDLSTAIFDSPKNLKCVDITKVYMGMAISYAIADKIILNHTRQRVQDMILDIKVAFTERIKKINWMDKKTKILTLEKSNEMLSLVGYPEWLMEEGALEKYYSDLIIHPDTYLDNMLSIVQRSVKLTLLQLYAGHERDWPIDTFPTTVNAYYVPWDNSIIVPMAFLFYPLYNLGLEVLNYAATGSTLGHELIHGFDNSGRQYDKFGNNIEWWDEKTVDRFEELAQCFVEQYNAFYVPEVAIYVNGQVSLGENIADNDGLRLAYMAYRNYRKRNKNEPKLPGLEQYTHDQMFFIAYASTWCDELELDNMAYEEDEPHCPKMYRLIGSLQNSDEFVKAFHCPKGSKMNPKVPKCSIW